MLKSWAVTRRPSFDPRVRRLAVHVEDHPLAYADFEGAIPAGEYGAGHVLIWDRGTWAPMGDPEEGFAKGVLKFRLFGRKLTGGWTLVRLKRQEKRDNWLLIKERDDAARDEPEDADEKEEADGRPDDRSVVSGRTLAELSAPATETVASISGARRADMAEFVAPQLAMAGSRPPEGEGWLHEIKLDGYRALARVDEGRTRFFTRNGLDWTDRYRDLTAAFRGLPCRRALIDGEIIVQDEKGVSSFSRLQETLSREDSAPLLFFAFDLLYLDDYDLREAALADRKEVLTRLLAAAGRDRALQLSEHVGGSGERLLAEGCRMGIEGIISKRADAPYRSGRGRTWRKSKCVNADDFVVLGFTRSAAAGGLAALLLARMDEAGMATAYVGKAGTGFTRAIAADLESRLEAIQADRPAVPVPAEVARERPVWVEPRLVVEVRYANVTADGRLRQAAFKGLRLDKPASSALASSATSAEAMPAPASSPVPSSAPSPAPSPAPVGPARRWVSDADLASVWVTNPERRMFDTATKLDIALYYARVGDWLLTELAGRPLTLVRCPSGRTEDCFYQRNATPGMPEAVARSELPPLDDEPAETVIHVDDAAGLLALAQFGVVELHCRGCRVADAAHPDRIVFDLDPDEALGWPAVVAAALVVRERLQTLGLVPFVKTTGGKGLHVVVPIVPGAGWAEVLAFAEGFASALAAADPARFTKNMAKRARKGKTFIDYLRNGRTATAVGAYSLRARPGLTVATPLGWAELEETDEPRVYDYRSVPLRLSHMIIDPWRELEASARVISKEARRFAGLNE